MPVKPYLRSIENTISKERADSYLRENVFNTEEFALHIERTANNLDIDKQMVRDVLESYWSNIFYLVNTVQKVNLKINVTGYFSLFYQRGKNIYIKRKKR